MQPLLCFPVFVYIVEVAWNGCDQPSPVCRWQARPTGPWRVTRLRLSRGSLELSPGSRPTSTIPSLRSVRFFRGGDPAEGSYAHGQQWNAAPRWGGLLVGLFSGSAFRGASRCLGTIIRCMVDGVAS